MPNFESISFEMTQLYGAGRICPPHVCVIQKTPCGTGLRVITLNPVEFFTIFTTGSLTVTQLKTIWSGLLLT